jgi:type II secretory pathway component GspD/PulD (secretin)
VVNQVAYVQDFDVEVAQTAFIADPVIGIIQEGLSLDVRPTVSNDRQFITLEARPTVVDLILPIQTFTTLLGAAAAPGRVVLPAQNPVVIQLPEIDVRQAQSTLRIPDGGSVLMGGLKDITVVDAKSTAPVLGNVPVLGFLFGRQGKSDEVIHTMVILTATITDPMQVAAGW